jgi:phenylacetate-CoA ligase
MSLQEKKIRHFMKIVYFHHPYYGRLMRKLKLKPGDIKTKEDLRKFPVTTKIPLRRNPRDFILQPKQENMRKTLTSRQKLSALTNMEKFKRRMMDEYYPTTFFATSGKTGSSTAAFLTKYDLELIRNNTMALIERVVRDIKKPVGQNMFPFAPHLAFWQMTFGIIDYGMFWFSMGAERTETQIQLMEKFKTNVIAAMPTYVKRVSDVARESKIKSCVKKIVIGGEAAPEGMIKRIKDNFSAIGKTPEIINAYGMTESKIAMMECKEGSGIHIFPHIHVWELVDKDTMEPVEEDGLLVFSHIDMRGTVFVRYLTGDFLKGRIEEGVCHHCGSSTPRIVGKIKRIIDMDKALQSTKIKGVLVDLDVFDEIMCNIENIDQYQVIIKKENKYDPYSRDVVEIHIGPDKRVVNVNELVRRVKEKMKSNIEITPKVKVRDANKIFDNVMGPLKGARVVDKRKQQTEKK